MRTSFLRTQLCSWVAWLCTATPVAQTTPAKAATHLIGTKSNKAAIGARLTVKAGDLVQFSEVRGGASYLSQNDLRLHFGLGANHKMTEVSIRWPNGETQTLHDVPADLSLASRNAGVDRRRD